MNTQSREEFIANWDRQVGCADQYEPAVSDAVWSQMLESDPVGATWGTGVRRAPQTATWGWNQTVAAKVQLPALLVSGAHDKQVPTANVQQLFTDLGSPQKVFIDLACWIENVGVAPIGVAIRVRGRDGGPGKSGTHQGEADE